MSKEDAPAPDKVPTKRRPLRDAPALWIAQWLARPDLRPHERRLLEEEKHRRKVTSPDHRVGLVIGNEGMTPEQLQTFREVLPSLGATEVHHPGVPSKVHGVCRSLGVPVIVHRDPRNPDEGITEVVKGSDMIIATPRDSRSTGGDRSDVWESIKYARHRRVPVKVIMPNGESANGV